MKTRSIALLLAVSVSFSTGCVSHRTTALHAPIAGDYRTTVELFLVAPPSPKSHPGLALCDRDFHGVQIYDGAPSIAAWQASPSAYPLIRQGLPVGTLLTVNQVEKFQGFSAWFGFVRGENLLASVAGYDGVNVHDLLKWECCKDPTEINPRFAVRVE